MRILEKAVKAAASAKLVLAENELAKMTEQLQTFVGYINMLRALPPGEELPLAAQGDSDCGQGLRRLTQEQVLALAPDSHRGWVRGPRVLNDEL